VPLARDLHPEFGYVGFAPGLCRKLGLVLAFIVFGLVAGASGVAVFMADPDPDPMHAMALAPAEALIGAPGSSPTAAAKTKATKADMAPKTWAQKPPKTGEIKSPCRESTTEHLGGDCMPGRAIKPRPVQAINERPAIASVPIGHREAPALLPSEPAAPVAAAPETPDGSATPADAADATPALAQPPAPPPAAKKARPRSNQQVQRREEHSPSRSSSNHDFQSGYARIW
jgi:hypothetical protein